MENRQFRQGDVLLLPVEAMPNHATPLERENGQIVLAHGEATGHAHAIREKGCELHRLYGERYLEVKAEDCVLRHEEHAPIPLPVGIYRVLRQREYVPQPPVSRSAPLDTPRPQAVRYVAD